MNNQSELRTLTERKSLSSRSRMSSPEAPPQSAQHELSNEIAPAQVSVVASPAPQVSLKKFVADAWKILEPVTTLSWNWHHDLISEYLTLIAKGEFQKSCPEKEGIIFNVPPRTMKSLLITVFFPAWVWTFDPARRFMFVSYSEKLSTQHSVYRRTVMESHWYKELWGKAFAFARDNNLKHHYENSARGVMFSTGMQATATGLGGDVLVFDDPLNPEQALSDLEREAVNLRFDSTFRSRINNPATGVKIILMQRLHESDLTGHVLAREPSRWEHVCLPAIAGPDRAVTGARKKVFHYPPDGLLWSARLSQSFLTGQKIGMGSWAFNGQYQQNPAPMEGGIIKRNWVRFYHLMPAKFDYLVQSWDCTFSGSDGSDFVAGQLWGSVGNKFYMLPYRTYDRLDFAPTLAAIKACQAARPEIDAVLIEDKANGPAIVSELKKELSNVIPIEPHGGKLSRAQAMAPLWESGSVELPDPTVFKLPWMDAYIHNICSFPRAAHDDDMDATSQALIHMRKRIGNGWREYARRMAEQAGQGIVM